MIPRDNKNRPPQLSSKRPVPTLRVAPGLAAAPPAAQRARDPRFDALVGGGDEVDMAMWRTKYAWLADRQREEVKQAKAALKDSAAASKKAARPRTGGSEGKRRLKARQLGDEEAQALEKAYHWCSAEVDGAVMRVVAHGIDHKQLDAFELSLPAGDALEALRERNPGRARRIEGL